MRTARPSGLNDRLPPEAQALRACQKDLQGVMGSFGYQEVDTPILEFVDLFLAKAGPTPGMRLFTLEHGGRRLCLRPEFTASIGRLFVEHLQGWPRPIRLQFAGPVFRPETPQRGRSRQFTMVGAELLGADGPLADAEVIALACTALQEAGVRRFQVRVGHVGLVQTVLRGLGLSQRGQQFVLRHMESLRKSHLGRAHVEGLLDTLYPSAQPAVADSEAREGVPNGALAEALSRTLASQGGFLGSRSPEEIAKRLVEKRRVSREREAINQALDAVEELGQLAGPSEEARCEAGRYFQARGWDDAPLANLQATLESVSAHGIPQEQVWLDLGMGRGLHYYTGMVFEIHWTGHSRGDSQLSGGGRYDDLLRELGTRQPVPAAGFAFGLERVVSALEKEEAQAPDRPMAPDVLVVPVDADDAAYAIQIARQLRRETSLRVELQVKAHLGLGPSLRLAHRRGIPLVVIAGAEEREGETALLRQMSQRTQQAVPLPHLPSAVLDAHRQEGSK